MHFATRLRFVLMLAGSCSLISSGCASSLLNTEMLKPSNLKPSIMDGHGTEQRVITLFTDALAEDNETAFRRIVSTRFEQKALRAKDSYKDLEILSLPKTKLEVVESKELGEGRMETVAKEEKEGTKYQFIIVRDEAKRRWVVDDVMLRQQKKGTRATKSSVEVMDLLLTIREFLDTWEAADRDSVLQAVSKDLREPLQKLPEPWLQRMIARITSEYETGMARRPQAQMNEHDAVVKMPSKNGFLLMKVAREDEKWLVSDIEVINRKSDDHPGSVLRQSRAMNAVTDFLTAYNENDLEQLRKSTEEKFFRNSLSVGDLSLITMPSPDHAPEDFQIQSFAGQLTVMIPEESHVVRLDLTTPELANAKDNRKSSPNATVESEFIIGDVTIYDRQTQQQRNLKSAFTAPARASLFLTALQSKDLDMLKQFSARSLSEDAWDRIDPTLIGMLPVTGVPSGEMTLQSSRVKGEVTELEFLSSSGSICSVLMRDENGDLKVEDVQYPDASASVASLRTQLMLTVPVIEMAHAWQMEDLEAVRKTSSTDFNRLVWSNLKSLPPQFEQLPLMLQRPVVRTELNEQRALLELADVGDKPVTVSLLRENSAWVVDEISMPQGDGTQFEVRKTLRHEIAQQFLVDPSGGIQQAHFENAGDFGSSGIVQAGNTTSTKPRGNLTVQSYGKPPVQSAALPKGIDMTPSVSAPPLSTPKVAPSAVPSGGLPASKPKADETGTLRFGPSAAKGSTGNDGLPPHIRPRSVAESEEHDGVVYFKGDTKAAKKPTPATSEGDVEESMESSSDLEITDPSQHPIEIPME